MTKKYIAAITFLGGDEYYVITGDEEWHNTYDPKQATVFDTANEAMEWMKTNTTMDDRATAVKLNDAISRFDKWVAEGMIRGTMPTVNHDFSRPYDPDNDTPRDVIDWWINCNKNDYEIRFEDYTTWPKPYELYEHIWDIGGTIDTDSDNIRTFPSVYTHRDADDFDKFSRQLQIAIDISQTLDNDGNKVIDVFDHYLCEGGNSVTINVLNNNSFDVVYRGSAVTQHDLTRKQLFEYLKQHRYYE